MNNMTETLPGSVAQATPGAVNLRRKSLLATGIGNLLEWFDWTLYTVASVYIAAALFDKSNPTSALLATLAVFAAGFCYGPWAASSSASSPTASAGAPCCSAPCC